MHSPRFEAQQASEGAASKRRRAYFLYDAAHPATEDALRATPYTSWALARPKRAAARQQPTRRTGCAPASLWLRGDTVMAVFSVAAAAYILSGLVQDS